MFRVSKNQRKAQVHQIDFGLFCQFVSIKQTRSNEITVKFNFTVKFRVSTTPKNRPNEQKTKTTTIMAEVDWSDDEGRIPTELKWQNNNNDNKNDDDSGNDDSGSEEDDQTNNNNGGGDEEEEEQSEEEQSEEEQANSNSNNNNNNNNNSNKKKKLNKYALPTAEELTQLRETQELFRSNLVRLQINEILKEATPKKSNNNNLKQFLFTLRDVILTEKTKQKTKNVDFPALDIQQKQINTSDLEIVETKVLGSFLLSTTTKSRETGKTIDLGVLINNNNSNNNNNHRAWKYLHETRKLCLSLLAQRLQKGVEDGVVQSVVLGSLAHDPSKQVFFLT